MKLEKLLNCFLSGNKYKLFYCCEIENQIILFKISGMRVVFFRQQDILNQFSQSFIDCLMDDPIAITGLEKKLVDEISKELNICYHLNNPTYIYNYQIKDNEIKKLMNIEKEDVQEMIELGFNKELKQIKEVFLDRPFCLSDFRSK